MKVNTTSMVNEHMTTMWRWLESTLYLMTNTMVSVFLSMMMPCMRERRCIPSPPLIIPQRLCWRETPPVWYSVMHEDDAISLLDR
jgi:hypothetical protein